MCLGIQTWLMPSMLIVLTSYAEIFWKKFRHNMFLHAVFYWNGTRSWNPCLLEAKDLHIAEINAMTADELYKKSHQMETFSTLLAICAGNSPVPGEFPAQRPVTRSFDVFVDLRLNKRLSKQSWGWWFETLSRPLWRQGNGTWAMYLPLVQSVMIRAS